MKKLFCIILAAVTVMSTSVFAAPSAQVTEMADEKLNVTDTVMYGAESEARLNDESIDENAPIYGVKSFCEDYERFAADYEMAGSDWKVNDDVWHAYSGYSSRRILENQSGKYLAFAFNGATQYPLITYASNTDHFAPMSEGTEVTVFTDIMMPSVTFENVNFVQHMAQFAKAGQTSYTSASPDNQKPDEWFTQITTFTVPETDSVSQIKICPWLKENGTQTIYLDNIAVYYKPAASAEYTVTVDYPTVTVTAADGIEAEAVKALCAYPSRYFGNAVSACTSDGTTITLTLNENSAASEIVIPSLVNAGKSASYNEKTVEIPSADYNALLYGVKSFCEDYERFAADYEMKASDWKLDDNVWHAYAGCSSRKIVENGGGKYLAFTFDGSTAAPYIMYGVNKAGYFDAMADGAQITMMSDVLLPEAAFENVGYVQHMTQYDGDENALPHNSKPKNQKAGEWFTQVTTFTVPETKKAASFKFSPMLNDGTGTQTVYFDNLAVYYKPAVSLEPAVSISANTVSAVYSEAIEHETAKALELYGKKYFGDAVSALYVSDDAKTVTAVLSDGTAKITFPVFVNADKSASYDGFTADLNAYNPVSVDEKEVRLTSSNSGLRFKAYVLNENIPEYTEFGYVVSLEQTLQNAGFSAAELEIGMDNVKYICKAAYKSDGSANFIYNKGYLDNSATLFTGVLTGIPAGKYDLNLVARPYALKNDGTYVYGESMVGNVRDVALEVKNDAERYNSLSDAEKSLIDGFVNNKA